MLTGNGYFDVAGTAAIGLLLVASPSCSASRPSACSSGSRPARRRRPGCATSLERTEGVERVIHMKTLHLGPEELLVGVKIGVSRQAAAADVAASIDAAERAMREAEPTARVIYVEPDIYVEGHEPDPRPRPPEPAGH